MDEDEWGFVEGSYCAAPFRPSDALAIGFGLARDLFGSFEAAFAEATRVTWAHGEWLRERHQFLAEAAVEIETLTEGTDG